MWLLLDARGEDVVHHWAATAAIDDVNLVEEVLTAFSFGDGRYRAQWKTEPAVGVAPRDILVEPRPGLLIRIRPFVPDEDEGLFSVVSIVEG